MKNLLALSMMALLLVLMFGCTETNAPVDPQPAPARLSQGSSLHTQSPLLSAELPHWEVDSEPYLGPLQWPLPMPTDMPLNATDVTATVGASIPFSGSVPNADGSFTQVFGSFFVPPAAFPNDTKITLSLDAKALAIHFEPEGMVFSRQTILNWTIIGLGRLPKDPPIHFCYVDNNGMPTEMPNGGVIVDYDHGVIQVQEGVVPHFSRYAFIRW